MAPCIETVQPICTHPNRRKLVTFTTVAAVVEADILVTKLLHEVQHGCGSPVMTIAWVFDCSENLSLARSLCNLFNSIVQHVGLLDLQLVCTLQPINLVRLGFGPERYWLRHPKTCELGQLPLTCTTCCLARWCYPDCCNVVCFFFQKFAQLIYLSLIFQLENANVNAT